MPFLVSFLVFSCIYLYSRSSVLYVNVHVHSLGEIIATIKWINILISSRCLFPLTAALYACYEQEFSLPSKLDVPNLWDPGGPACSGRHGCSIPQVSSASWMTAALRMHIRSWIPVIRTPIFGGLVFSLSWQASPLGGCGSQELMLNSYNSNNYMHIHSTSNTCFQHGGKWACVMACTWNIPHWFLCLNTWCPSWQTLPWDAVEPTGHRS